MPCDTSFYNTPFDELNILTSEMEKKLQIFKEKTNITDTSLIGYDRFDRHFGVRCHNYEICTNFYDPLTKSNTFNFGEERPTGICDWCTVPHTFIPESYCYKCDTDETTCVKIDYHTDCTYQLCINCFVILTKGTIALQSRPIFPYPESLWYTYDIIASHSNQCKEEFEKDLKDSGYISDEEEDADLLKEILEIHSLENVFHKYPLLESYHKAFVEYERQEDRISALHIDGYICPYCDDDLDEPEYHSFYYIPEILPLYIEESRDTMYEEHNKISHYRILQSTSCYKDEVTYGLWRDKIPTMMLKCKNYSLCGEVILDNNYQNHCHYLCTSCVRNFGGYPPNKGILPTRQLESCPICLEEDTIGISLPKCDHYICVNCMKKCFYKRPYPSPPTGEEDNEITFQECLLQQTNEYIASFLVSHPKFIRNYFEVLEIEREFLIQERGGNLRSCPLCRA